MTFEEQYWVKADTAFERARDGCKALNKVYCPGIRKR
jgi:hypothetical protein